MTVEDLLAMQLHESQDIDEKGSFVTRVPGGWIYKLCGGINTASVFVPEPTDPITYFQPVHSEVGRECPI